MRVLTRNEQWRAATKIITQVKNLTIGIHTQFDAK
jgi:hypothetical protein